MDPEKLAFMKSINWTMTVREVQPGEVQKFTAGGVEHIKTDPGVSVSELMERFGGVDGEIEDPFGNTHQLSLVEWAKKPDARLRIGFTSSKFRADDKGNPLTG